MRYEASGSPPLKGVMPDARHRQQHRPGRHDLGHRGTPDRPGRPRVAGPRPCRHPPRGTAHEPDQCPPHPHRGANPPPDRSRRPHTRSRPGQRPAARFLPRKRSDMTVAIPAVTFPGGGTGRDMTGHRPASGLLVIMARPVAPTPDPGSQPVPPRWSRDRSGLWLRNAAAGLCVLAAAAAAVSFTAQYRMVDATRHLPVIAALEALIPDAAALIFACLGIALALHGRRALRARALNLASVGASVFMNAIAAAPGWRNLAIWILPPIAYALASDTLIGVVRTRAITRHLQPGIALAADAAIPLAVLGGLALWLLRLALAPTSTLAGFRAWVLEQCPVAPGRRAPAPRPASVPPPRKATKTAR